MSNTPARPPHPQPIRQPGVLPKGPVKKSSGVMGMIIGVGVSVFIVLAIIVTVVIVLSMGGGLGEPTEATTGPGKLEKISYDPDLGKLIAMPGGSGAEKTYDEAVSLVFNGKRDQDGFMSDIKQAKEPEKVAEFKAMLDVLERASDQGFTGETMTFNSVKITPITEFDAETGLTALGMMANKAAMSYWRDKNDAAGDRANRAAMLYGYRLWKNGAYVSYKAAGIAVLGESLALAKYHYEAKGDKTKQGIAAELDRERLAVAKRFDEKTKTIAPRKFPTELIPADLANMADHDRDRAWRMEGLMWIGVSRWASKPALVGVKRQAAIVTYLEKHEQSSTDPMEAAAAKVGKDLTKGDVSTIPTTPSH